MKKSVQTRKEIKNLAEEVSTLKARRNSVSKELKKVKQGLTSNWDDPEARSQVQTLKADREILDEVIQEKESSIQVLEEELSRQSEYEERNQKYERLKQLCISAEEKSNIYLEKLKDLDQEFTKKLSEILSVKLSWAEDAKEFMNLAEELGKGFKRISYDKYIAEGKGKELGRDELIQKIESEDGISLIPVMSDEVLETRYYSMTKAIQYPDLIFKDYYQMIERSTIYDLLEKVEH